MVYALVPDEGYVKRLEEEVFGVRSELQKAKEHVKEQDEKYAKYYDRGRKDYVGVGSTYAKEMLALGNQGYTANDKERLAMLSQQLQQSAGYGSLPLQQLNAQLACRPGAIVPFLRSPNVDEYSALGAYQKVINQKTSEILLARKQLAKPFLKTKEKHMFGFAKEYLDRHKDTVMTVLVALFVDHFFLGGALRGKIKAITESVLDNAQKKLSHTPDGEKKDAA